jgi:general secretion pathway protein I
MRPHAGGRLWSRRPLTPAGRSRRPLTPRHPRGGFTLLEVAIALAILGIGVVTVLELFSAALRMEASAGVRARAVVYARALLDQTVAVPEIQAGVASGQYDDGYRWERRIREAPEFTDQGERTFDVESDLSMFEIEVSVLWPESGDREGVYTIRTLRVAQRAGV